MKTIDNYLQDVTPSQRETLEHIRKIIHESVPEVEETISWDMPTFKYKQRNLIHFAAFKDHMSLFPGSGPIKAMKHKLKGYTISKGTIQFTEEKPILESIIKEILHIGMNDISKN